VDAAVTVPEFGGWAGYDPRAHQWLTCDHIKTLAAAWFKRHGADCSCKTMDDPSVIESFERFSHSADWEFLDIPRAVGMGLSPKNDLDRIDTILDVSWARHRERRVPLSL